MSHAPFDSNWGALEVQAFFRGIMLSNALVVPNRRGCTAFTIGHGKRVNAPVPQEMVPDASFPLVAARHGALVVEVTPSMSGDVLIDGRSEPLAAFVARHGARFQPPPGSQVRIACGATSFVITPSTPPALIPPPPFRYQRDRHLPLIGTALALALFLALVSFLPPEPRTIAGDLIASGSRFIPLASIPPAPPPASGGHAGGRPGGAPGTTTPREVRARPARVRPTPGRRLDRESAPVEIGRRGILGVLAAADGNSWRAIFAEGTALGDGAEALRSLDGVAPGAGVGLAPVGTGSGGAGVGEATIGVGRLGTIGIRRGPGEGVGLDDRRVAALRRGPRVAVPAVAPGRPAVRGALDREIVRRVIRRHLNEVKFCYERALPGSPALTGRVTVQFTITSDGRTAAALVQDSTLGSPAVESCIVQAVRRWTFPQPEGGGLVVVSYPFVLLRS